MRRPTTLKHQKEVTGKTALVVYVHIDICDKKKASSLRHSVLECKNLGEPIKKQNKTKKRGHFLYPTRAAGLATQNKRRNAFPWRKPVGVGHRRATRGALLSNTVLQFRTSSTSNPRAFSTTVHHTETPPPGFSLTPEQITKQPSPPQLDANAAPKTKVARAR